MSEYAKNIQTIEDMWKKRIELPKLTEVVRCRDCKHYNTNFGGGCAYFNIGNAYGQEPESMIDGFCAWGERNDSETVEVWKPSSPDDVTCYEEG